MDVDEQSDNSEIFLTSTSDLYISLPLLHIKTKVKSSSQCLTVLRTFSGDHTVKETPVPIPNTAVKLSGPMIVPTSAKVGIARFYSQKPRSSSKELERGFCLRPH